MSLGVPPRVARRSPAGAAARAALLERLNQAVRRPEEFGGLATVVDLLDRLAALDPRNRDHVWLPDTNVRLAPSTMVRHAFPDADIHVVASQFGEDAHRLGWLRLDRTLTRAEHAVLVDHATAWAKDDRSLDEIVAAFGPASVTFGSTAPDRPKTLSYATADPLAPVVAFHLGHAQAGTEPTATGAPPAGVALLAVRVREDFVRGWTVTPHGDSYFS